MDIETDSDIGPEPQATKQHKKSDKGFTLIALLIVIVILGVLSTVVVLSVGGITAQGKDSACKSDYNALATAVETYYAQEGSYPASQTVLRTDGFLRTLSTSYDISGTSGNIEPATGSDCTYDPDGA